MTLRHPGFFVSALCCFVMAAGCNEVAGIKEPVSGEGGTTPTPTPPEGPAAFVGSWTASDYTRTFANCPSAGTSKPESATISIATGTTTDELRFMLGQCPLRASVNGSVATLLGEQTCVLAGTTTAGDSFRGTFAYQDATFQLGSSQATMRFAGQAQYSDTAGATETCLFEDTGTFTKQQ